jgi:polyisoprenoid-binding protein YceI
MRYTDAIRNIEGRTVPPEGDWELDIPNTFATFTAPHLVLARVKGRIPGITGSFTVAADPSNSRLEVELDARTLTSDDEKRDQHLISEDFIHVEKFPTIYFSSTSIQPVDDLWKLTGDLTIRGITNSVTLDVRFLGLTYDWGRLKSLFHAETVIDRHQWGMKWNRPLEWGGVAVGREVRLEIHAQAKLIEEE